jgi:hypothetical protein
VDPPIERTAADGRMDEASGRVTTNGTGDRNARAARCRRIGSRHCRRVVR